MYLVIAEKPGVSQAIGKVIGAYKKGKGYLSGRDCIVSWCLGHLAEYDTPEGYGERYAKWKLEDLPIIPEEWKLAVAQDKEEQLAVLKELLNRTDITYVVNACDAGREGELIFKRVYDLSGSSLPVKRLWISSMEDSAIAGGFARLKDGREYENLCRAAVCRAQADWLVGINATRAYTTAYSHRLTVGRVQTPTLAMMAERADAIKNFQKQRYFTVSLNCGDGLIVNREKISDKEEAEWLVFKCSGKEAIVEDVKSAKRIIKPPKLYDLTTLQRESNRYFGYTAKQTLGFAQSLYEKKLVTYPRTDSQFLSDDMEGTAEKVIRIVLDAYHIGPFSYPENPDVRRVLDSGKVSDHHAIIPTAEIANADLDGLPEGERKLLELVSLRLLCAAADPCKYGETEITISCNGEIFHAKGKTVLEAGWKDIAKRYQVQETDGDAKGAEKGAGKALPHVEKGQRFPYVGAVSSEHYTTPPKAYTEDTLLSAMETAGNREFDADTEKKGLGTPATRASIIEKLVNSGFAKRSGRQITITDSGRELVGVLPEKLKSASLTAEWENRLLGIEKGADSPEEFMDGIRDMVNGIVADCRRLPSEECRRFGGREEIGICPACNSPVFEGKKNFYCSNRDCRFVLWKENRYLESMKKKLDKRMAEALLRDGRVHVSKLYSAKKDKFFDADILLDVTGEGRAGFRMEFPQRGSQKKM